MEKARLGSMRCWTPDGKPGWTWLLTCTLSFCRFWSVAWPLNSKRPHIRFGPTVVGGRKYPVCSHVLGRSCRDGHLDCTVPFLSASDSANSFYRVQTICQAEVGNEIGVLHYIELPFSG